MSERLAARTRAISPPTARWLLLAAGLAALVGGALAFGHDLGSEPIKDEKHFIETSRELVRELPPGLEALRSYEEVITPFAFLFWGLLDRWTGDGLFAGRLCNLALVVAIVCGIALRRGRPTDERLLAAAGAVAFPYLIGLGLHLYTDVPASFLAFLGVRAHLRGRSGLGFALLCLAIATRQYMVAVPVALCGWEWSRSVRGEARRWREGAFPAAAAATLVGWFAFFGGLAPEAGLERWLPKYPAPMTEAGSFIVGYGLYFLSALAVYFVLPELLLFGRRIRWRALAAPRNAVIAGALGVLFFLFPPNFDAWNGGAVDRVMQMILPPGPATGPRMVAYWGLAVLTGIRFGQRLDLAFWVVAVHSVMLTKAQLPWDKYYLPVIVVLWLLEAERLLDGRVFPPERTSPPRSRS